MSLAEHVARIVEMRVGNGILVGTSEGKRLLGRPRFRWEYNIKVYLQEVRREAWTGLIRFKIRTGDGLL